MTDFLVWWADHWPLAAIAIPAYFFYPIYANWLLDVQGQLIFRYGDWSKRRREP